MAVDVVCGENTSPRLSFSYDINQETKPHESSIINGYNNSNNNSDFDFPEVTGEELSPADELFSQGRIRPLMQIGQNFSTTQQFPKPEQPKTESLRTLMAESPNRDESSPATKPPALKFLWPGVKRSSSLHCENTHKKTSSFWSISLLSRSKSTGYVSNSKQSLNKQSPKQSRRSPSPLMKKDYGNGVRVNPVLNFPPNPSRGSLSFCSLFGRSRINGKDVKNNKK